jgi:hypothetical protein
MAQTTIWFGGLLTLFGIGSYFGTGGTTFTALIPTLLGLPLIVLGVLAQNQHNRVIALRVAAVIGLVGLLGTLGGLSGVASALFLGGKETPALSLTLQAIMALGCALFVGFHVRDMFNKPSMPR